MSQAQVRYYEPEVDIYENGGGVVVLADIPGVMRDKVDLKLESGVLFIDAISNVAQGESSIGYKKSLVFSSAASWLDAGNISATLNDGVLRIEIPRGERYQTKRIAVV